MYFYDMVLVVFLCGSDKHNRQQVCSPPLVAVCDIRSGVHSFTETTWPLCTILKTRLELSVIYCVVVLLTDYIHYTRPWRYRCHIEFEHGVFTHVAPLCT